MPGLGDDEEDQAEAQDVPEALIEEGGVDLHVAAIDGGEAHPPGEGGLGAEGLPVHEVAPAADGLAQHEAHDAEVRHGPQPDALAAAVEEGHEEDGDDGAVDGEAAVPDGDDAAPVEAAVGIPEAVQVEEDIVGPGTQDAEGHAHEDQVQQVILLDAVMLGLPQAEEHAEEHAQAQNDAVPVDAVADVEGHGVGGEFPVPKEAGEADGGVREDVGIGDGHASVPSFSCSSAGRIRERAMRSSRTFCRRKARISSGWMLS